MKCRDTQRLLSDWVDNALPTDEARALEQHLKNCGTCAAERRRIDALRQLVALKRFEKPEPSYYSGMLDEFHRRLVAQRSARRAARWARFDTVGLQHWWERTRRVLHSHPLLALRYGLATVLAAALILNAAVLALLPRLDGDATSGHEQGPKLANSPTYMLERLPTNGANDSVPF